jgi:hypothetical protein
MSDYYPQVRYLDARGRAERRHISDVPFIQAP